MLPQTLKREAKSNRSSVRCGNLQLSRGHSYRTAGKGIVAAAIPAMRRMDRKRLGFTNSQPDPRVGSAERCECREACSMGRLHEFRTVAMK